MTEERGIIVGQIHIVVSQDEQGFEIQLALTGTLVATGIRHPTREGCLRLLIARLAGTAP